MRLMILFLLSVSVAFAQKSVISFSATNTVTWEVILPDSVYIENITQNRDTMLVETTLFDLNSMTDVETFLSAIPSQFAISKNYPNAFQNKTDFYINMPANGNVTITVHNILGRQVAYYSSVLASGIHAFTFDGSALATGLYFVHAQNSQKTFTIKILKSGNKLGDVNTIHYKGMGGGVPSETLWKTDFRLGDTYRFTLYAQGFIPQMLDNQKPVGGENYNFDLMPVPPPDDFTSNWRGFNLLGKFTKEWSNEDYIEDDFIKISDFGFNFVRLPIDYRTYTKEGDWDSFLENELNDIDNAVEWGEKYDIHVSINLHRAPGYCVNPPSEPLPINQDVSLWDDQSAQQAFAAHWKMFAERYKDVPNEALSFNLVNEPASVDGDVYVRAVLPAIQAIRQISPDRIIISDAVDWGNSRVDEILDYGVVMSPHFYNPMRITHHKASWIDGAESWPEPTWPPQLVSNYFYGSYKSPWNVALEIEGDFKAGTEITIHVDQVSTHADFRISGDNKTIYTKVFHPDAGEGEWKEVIYREEWNVYQNIYDRDYKFNVAQDVNLLSFRVYEGDWMTFSQLLIRPPDSSALSEVNILPGISDWGVPQASFRLDEKNNLILVKAPKGFENIYRMNGFLQQWIDLKHQGVPVHVGEWGVYNKTPHDVTLAFMENRLKAMKSAGLGWALWNFRGGFGVLDSDREDVDYEDYFGHKLDRKMLELLQRY